MQKIDIIRFIFHIYGYKRCIIRNSSEQKGNVVKKIAYFLTATHIIQEKRIKNAGRNCP